MPIIAGVILAAFFTVGSQGVIAANVAAANTHQVVHVQSFHQSEADHIDSVVASNF